MTTGYPLEAARQLRERAEAEARRALVERLEALDEARVARERAAEALRALREASREEPDSAHSSGAQLARAGAYAARLSRLRATLEGRLTEALAAERRAEDGVTEAQSGLADAAVATEVLERHKARWSAERAKRLERAREEARDELAQARWVLQREKRTS